MDSSTVWNIARNVEQCHVWNGRCLKHSLKCGTVPAVGQQYCLSVWDSASTGRYDCLSTGTGILIWALANTAETAANWKECESLSFLESLLWKAPLNLTHWEDEGIPHWKGPTELDTGNERIPYWKEQEIQIRTLSKDDAWATFNKQTEKCK